MPTRSRSKRKHKPTSHGASWTPAQIRQLRSLVRSGKSSSQVAAKLGRTTTATQQRAMRSGIYFRRARRRKQISSI